MTKKKNPNGRPSTFTQSKADQICALIINGDSVRSICKMESMPARETLISWLARNQEFSHQYAQALAARTHFKAEERHEILMTAMDEVQDLPEGVNSNVYFNFIKERIRCIEWDAERLAAKRYKINDTENDKDEAQPLNINFSVNEPVKDIKVTNAKS